MPYQAWHHIAWHCMVTHPLREANLDNCKVASASSRLEIPWQAPLHHFRGDVVDNIRRDITTV